MQPERYIMDVLYGQVRLPTYLWRILPSPELQRLREVRLCNINSLCLTGGANINRYEHAIGTAHLALESLKNWPTLVPRESQSHIALAALLHDINSGAFGHSVQYVIDSEGFEHEAVGHMFAAIDSSPGFSYQQAAFEAVFFGMPKRLHTLLDVETAKAISELVAGGGEYGALICADMDVDNIDNVFRLAYHIGTSRDTRTPLRLAQSMWVDSGEVTISRQAVALVERWQLVRKRLYEFLLLNPDEFSAKCMLEQALTGSAPEDDFLWHDVDFELVTRLAAGSSDNSFLASRLMLGNLYGCLGVYASSDIGCHERLAPDADRKRLESALSTALRATGLAPLSSAVVRIHTIKDVGKTERRVVVRTEDGELVSLGTSSRCVLIGVFLENRHLSMDDLDADIVANPVVQRAVLGELLGLVGPVVSQGLYAEGSRERV